MQAHNPTGFDLNTAQWQQVATLLAERNALPLLDLAYHGLAHSLTADSHPLRIIAAHCNDWLCCYSCSKSFGLYNERTGALIIHTSTARQTARVPARSGEQNLRPTTTCHRIMSCHRGTDSGSEVLLQQWQQELDLSRQRVQQQRLQLVHALTQAGVNCTALRQQQGLFGYLNLNDRQLQQLAQAHAIYAGSGGRINISGVNTHNMAQISAGLAAVMQPTP